MKITMIIAVWSDVWRLASGVWKTGFLPHQTRLTIGTILFLGGLVPCLIAAETTTVHQDARRQTPDARRELVPIQTTLQTLNLDAFAALPVQHGGRYKPVHALAMEILNGIGGSATLGGGHTPVSSLLDLLFCRADYDPLPIIVIKNAELARDLAVVVPPGERNRLIEERRLTPARLADDQVQGTLEQLGRLTTKTKAINQVRLAGASVDASNLQAHVRLFAVPDGPHSDRWRSPGELAAPFADALADFIARAKAAAGAMGPFAQVGAASLPLSDATVDRLGLSVDAQRQVNMETLWPLWQAIGSGRTTFSGEALATDPAAAVKSAGLDGKISAGLITLRAAWDHLRLSGEQLATPTALPVLSAVVDRAITAWNTVGVRWNAARHGGTDVDLQNAVDALVTAVNDLRTQLDHDRQVRQQPPLVLHTNLELQYWRWNGFTGVAWCFLFAMPLLALGALGGVRWALRFGLVLFVLGAAGQLAAFVIRWQLAERVPLANLYESMAAAALLASLVAVMAEAVMARKDRANFKMVLADDANPAEIQALKHSQLVTSFGRWSWSFSLRPVMPGRGSFAIAASLFGCIIVMAQAFLERNDINAFISPAMPILSEFWLRVHTACVVASYGLIGMGGLMSVVYLLMRTRLRWDDPRSLAWDRTTFALNAAASVVLWAGLVLGAVWAAVSWGRPWGWDPKEVFALLTWVVFVMLIHLRLAVRPEIRGVATAWVSLAAFLVMGFNWYFVNVKLSGLHSYA